jgi:hypothetical protein
MLARAYVAQTSLASLLASTVQWGIGCAASLENPRKGKAKIAPMSAWCVILTALWAARITMEDTA